VVNCSEFFRNATVLDRRVMAHGRADPHRLNECVTAAKSDTVMQWCCPA
jgi:hypothetical protein